MHHHDIGFGQLDMLKAQAEKLVVFACGKRGFVLPLQLDAQHHDDVDVADRFAHVGGQGHSRSDLRELRGQQWRGSA